MNLTSSLPFKARACMTIDLLICVAPSWFSFCISARAGALMLLPTAALKDCTVLIDLVISPVSGRNDLWSKRDRGSCK